MMSIEQIQTLAEKEGITIEEFMNNLTKTIKMKSEKNELNIEFEPVVIEAAAAPPAPEIVEDNEEKIDNNKCMARTWRSGLGGQCSRKKIEGSDYCKLHSKRAEICSEPAVNKKGLWLGRVDQEKPEKDKDGKVVIEWPENVEAIREKMKNKKNKVKKEKKPKSKSRKRAPSAFDIFKKEKKEDIKKLAGESGLGTFQTKAAEIWKSLSEEEKAPYKEKSKKEKENFKKSTGPVKPKRPASAYLCFANEKRSGYKEKNPDLKMTDITKLISAEWKKTTDRDKWIKMAIELKKEYEVKMEEYKSKLPKEQPPKELFEDGDEEKEAITEKKSKKKAKKEEVVENVYEAETESSDEEEWQMYGFKCEVEPYKGETLALDANTKKIYKVVDGEAEFVGVVAGFEIVDGKPDLKTMVDFDFDSVEE